MQSTCPEATIWQTFLDGSISVADRASAESHLGHCRVCRERLIACLDNTSEREVFEPAPSSLKKAAIRSTSPQPRTANFMNSLRPYVPMALAATIVLAIGISFFLYRTADQIQPVSDLRQSGNATGELSLESPPNGAAVNPGKLEFRWSDAGAGSRYEFTLTDEKGDTIFHEKPASNFLSLDSSPRLSLSRRYYWSVLAKHPDGTQRESGVASFTLK